VEGDDPYAPTACKHFNGSLQPFFDRLQLAVDRDAECLEGAGRDVNVARPGTSWDGPGHHVDKVLRRPERRQAPPLDDPLRDPRSPSLLAVVPQDAPQLTLRFAIEQVGGGPRFAAVQSHVEWSVRLEAEAAIRIIDKKGPLNNPADRDHCIQYMIAVPLIFGRLTAADYEDSVAADPSIDVLRDKMECVEDVQFTKDYHDPEKRSIANALTVELNDGTKLKEVVVEYPIGHKRRREEGIPELIKKYKINLARIFPEKQQRVVLEHTLDYGRLAGTPVHEFVDRLVI